ncbi:hypothetical protein [Streptomyces goshikiensis]|uniref:hypothetical protein n=1 Tax=Streptomyces goshikiensis TaxID=1942 RepID=UPI0022F3CF22|nr:hypothetical protein [Streptomyces goshikiensis]WBY18463.1 hypothetical protein PET44_01830 [Streptomyces goshikiensis]
MRPRGRPSSWALDRTGRHEETGRLDLRLDTPEYATQLPLLSARRHRIPTALDEQTVVASTPSIGRQSAQERLTGTRPHVMARPETPTVPRCR